MEDEVGFVYEKAAIEGWFARQQGKCSVAVTAPIAGASSAAALLFKAAPYGHLAVTRLLRLG